MIFEVGGKGQEVVKISLEQDGNDVNVLVNGEVYMWFGGESKTLYYDAASLDRIGISVEEHE